MKWIFAGLIVISGLLIAYIFYQNSKIVVFKKDIASLKRVVKQTQELNQMYERISKKRKAIRHAVKNKINRIRTKKNHNIATMLNDVFNNRLPVRENSRN